MENTVKHIEQNPRLHDRRITVGIGTCGNVDLSLIEQIYSPWDVVSYVSRLLRKGVQKPNSFDDHVLKGLQFFFTDADADE